MKSRRIWFVVSVIIFVLIIGIVIVLEDEAQITQKPPQTYVPLVSVVEVQSQNNGGSIKTFAQVNPRWNLTVKSRVNGQVVAVSEKAFAGQIVVKGDLLLSIEDSAYQVALREAEQAVLSAQIDLTREQARADRAQADWAAAGNNSQPTQLALNIPQLELATRLFEVETSRLVVARNRLADTKILAPFSGVVTERKVSIGQNISEGEDLMDIVGNENLEIAVSLSRQQWEMLVEDWHNETALVLDTAGVEIGEAAIKRGGGFLDPQTRQYRLFLEVKNQPGSQVLPGDFVGVELPGRHIAQTLKIPQTALTREGFVWHVDGDNRLRKFSVQVLFYSGSYIIIKTPDSENPENNSPLSYLIATTPLASYLAGNLVESVPAGGN